MGRAKAYRLAWFVSAAALLSGCGVEYVDTPLYDSADYYFSANKLIVEVIYETGAEPYDGDLPVAASTPTPTPTPLWNILEDNIKALYQGRSTQPAFEIPDSRSQMIALPSQGKSGWTISDLVTLAEQHRVHRSMPGQAAFAIVFVKGYFLDESSQSTRPTVLGLSVNGTSVVAIFKDVVKDSSLILNIRKFVEQSTLVHEFGHSMGLVDNGIPLATNHYDSSAPTEHHCLNTNCVMYWANEGAADAVQFAQQLNSSGNTVIFGSECLNDARQFNPSP